LILKKDNKDKKRNNSMRIIAQRKMKRKNKKNKGNEEKRMNMEIIKRK